MILQLRGERVMLDADLAALYGVEIRVLVQAVKRNTERFPEDFMFQLTAEEHVFLRSQIVTLNEGGRGKHRKYLPYAFTEQGVAMLSSVLRSPAGRAGEYRGYARFREAQGIFRRPQGSGTPSQPTGGEIRQAVRRRLRCHSRDDESARRQKATHRIRAWGGGHDVKKR